MTNYPKRTFFLDRRTMPDADPDISRPRLIRDGTFLEEDRRQIAQRRRGHNQLGFAYQIAFVRVLGRFPRQEPLELDEEILRFAALQWGTSPDAIGAYAERRQTVSEHQQRIRSHLKLRAFDADTADELARFLEGEALRLDRTASLLGRARGWLRDERILAPATYVLRRAVGAARQGARTILTDRMAQRLSHTIRERLDALLHVGEDDPFSALNRIKSAPSSPSTAGMRRLLARLELIEETGVPGIDVSWVNGNYPRVLFHTVRTASAARLRRMAAPRRHLALVCFLHQAWRDTLDQAVDMYGKLLDRSRKLVEHRLDEKLKAQRHAVDRIVQRYRDIGAVLLDPGVGDTELRPRLLAVVSENELLEDQTDLVRWTRGDRRARFEETGERHNGMSRFAAPFLSRMNFLDEHGDGASPTLEAVRTYREIRSSGRRTMPPDAPMDFAPKTLVPLIRHDGAIDRRRWESALFLKVRDEVRAGNLAIDGAKNFGRFESFFLPEPQWQRASEAFWARTGFPSEPSSAAQQLRARLSAAFDRFLEDVPRNRQVSFDDDGWRLKTDRAEQLDPEQLANLAELHRWFDARRRSIRLADLLIEVENDLRFSAHFLRQDEKQFDCRRSMRVARRHPCPRLQPGPVHHGKARPRHPIPQAQACQRLAARRGEPARRARQHRPRHLAPRRRRTLGRRPHVRQRRPALRHAREGPAAPASTTSRWSSIPSSPTTMPRSTAVRSNAPTATHRSCSTACSTTKATSTSRSTTPIPTATPRSTSPPSP